MAKPTKPPSSSYCSTCKQTLPSDYFFENRDAKNGVDNWCSDCVNAFVNSKENMIEYCGYNNRAFSQELWDKCEQLAFAEIEAGKVAGLKSETAKSNFILRHTIYDYFKQMNATRWYQYEESNRVGQEVDMEAFDQAEDMEEYFSNELTYSEFWEGYYSNKELNKLNAMYKEYEADFDVPDVHTRNSFKNAVKFQNLVNKATQKVSDDPTKENIEHLEKMTKMLNMVSDAAKLNLSKRSSNDRGGFTDLGSLIARVESTGALCRKQEFEKDDVDLTIDAYVNGILASMINEDIDLEVDDMEQEAEINGA